MSLTTRTPINLRTRTAPSIFCSGTEIDLLYAMMVHRGHAIFAVKCHPRDPKRSFRTDIDSRDIIRPEAPTQELYDFFDEITWFRIKPTTPNVLREEAPVVARTSLLSAFGKAPEPPKVTVVVPKITVPKVTVPSSTGLKLQALFASLNK